MPHDKDLVQLRKAGGLGWVHEGMPPTAAPLRETGKEDRIAYSTDFCHPVYGNIAMQSMGALIGFQGLM